MSKALHIVSSLLEADPDEIPPKHFLHTLPHHSSECEQLCDTCRTNVCTLIHSQGAGKSAPGRTYHICLPCDLQSSAVDESGPDDVDPDTYVRDLPPREPRIAYALLPSEMADPTCTHVTPIIVKEGESGYHVTDWTWNKRFAEAALADLNARLGLTREEADMIFTKSLFAKPKTKNRRKLREEGPDDVRPKDLLMQVPSPHLSLKSEIDPGDEMTAPMRVVLKRSLRRGEWVTRLENMQGMGEYWGHYHDDYAAAVKDFESRCIKLGVSTKPAESYVEESANLLVAALLETDPDVVDPRQYLKDLPSPDRRIKITFSRTTPESSEQGDVSDSGWVDEEGVDMTPDRFDVEAGVTAVDKAVEFLQREGASEASSSGFHVGVWYSTGYQTINYRTGEDEERCLHLYGFTPKEEAEIYNQVIKPRHRYGVPN